MQTHYWEEIASRFSGFWYFFILSTIKTTPERNNHKIIKEIVTWRVGCMSILEKTL